MESERPLFKVCRARTTTEKSPGFRTSPVNPLPAPKTGSPLAPRGVSPNRDASRIRVSPAVMSLSSSTPRSRV